MKRLAMDMVMDIRTKREAQDELLSVLDIAASVMVTEYPALDKLDVYNALQLLSWKVYELQPSLASSVIRNK